MSGLMAIFWKELADHFNSKRFIILSILVYLAGILTIVVAAQNISSFHISFLICTGRNAAILF